MIVGLVLLTAGGLLSIGRWRLVVPRGDRMHVLRACVAEDTCVKHDGCSQNTAQCQGCR